MDTNSGCTLAEYAEAKCLLTDEFDADGVRDGSWYGTPAVEMDYADEDGLVLAVRYRIALNGDRFRWRPGDKPILYGLWRLAGIRERGFVILVEGESDCHTLWHYDLPALGIPGASAWRDEWAHYFDGITRIYFVREPDEGGTTLLETLARSPIDHRIFVVRLEEAVE